MSNPSSLAPTKDSMRQRIRELGAEAEALRAENEALRAALKATKDRLEGLAESSYGTRGISEHTMNILAQARAALAKRTP